MHLVSDATLGRRSSIKYRWLGHRSPSPPV